MLVEKPFAANAEQAKEMAQAAKHKDLGPPFISEPKEREL